MLRKGNWFRRLNVRDRILTLNDEARWRQYCRSPAGVFYVAP